MLLSLLKVRFFAVLVACALTLPGMRELAAQGTIVGSISEEVTGRTLAGAQVFISEIFLGTLARGDGRFLLLNVPAGTHTVTVEMLGYASASEEVEVSSGQTVTLDFLLGLQALELDAIVVTGTAGVTQRRQIGHSVAVISAAAVTERASVQDLNQLLQGRVSGATMITGSGNTGGVQPIALRGFSSISRSTQPLVYLDGVRISADAGVSTTRGQGSRGRLNDINPADIESVEIIKGPAASTLYGSEASNGVIHIITKQGRPGAPTFSISMRQGAQFFLRPDLHVKDNYATDPVTGELIVQNLYESEKALGNNIFETGLTQTYTADVSGGSGSLNYFASATRQDDRGIVSNQFNERNAVRLNLNTQAADNLRFSSGIGYTVSETGRPADSGSFNQGFFELINWGSPLTRNDPKRRGFLQGPPEESAKISNTIDVNRVTWNFRAEHEPTSWLSHRLVGGMEGLSEQYSGLYPRQPEGAQHQWAGLALGVKQFRAVQVDNRSLDYSASATFDPSPTIVSTTSVGLQYHTTTSESLFSEGRNHPAPGLSTVSAAATRTTSDTFLQDKSWGAYIQQRFDLWNQLHITGAVRGDDHSAFGVDIDPTIYPKLSGSWTVTESAWDPGFIDDLQLRAAWGVAGNQPSTFSSIRTYEPTFGYNDAPGIRPFRPGNPLLKPERTSEIEGGFDAVAFGGRLSLEVTAFTQTTSDAILERDVAPSAGFSAEQVINVAEIRNRGFEVSTTVRPVERSGLSWDLTFLLGHQVNEIIDLGGINAGRRHQEGFAVGSEFDRIPIWADIDPVTGVASNPLCFVGEGGVRAPHRSKIFTQFTHPGTEIYGGRVVPCSEAPNTFVGNAGPNWQASLSTSLNIGPNLRLYAMAEGWFDMMGTSSTTGARLRLFANDIRTHTLSEQSPGYLAYHQGKVTSRFNVMAYMRSDFVKLREVSATYTLPASWVERIGASGADFALIGRNLLRIWTHQDGKDMHDPDPEGRNSSTFWNHGRQSVFPQLTRLETSLRLTF